MNIQTILTNLNIDALNEMQQASVEAYRKGNDLILLSPTGSGKTLAYLLPVLSSLQKGIEGTNTTACTPSSPFCKEDNTGNR